MSNGIWVQAWAADWLTYEDARTPSHKAYHLCRNPREYKYNQIYRPSSLSRATRNALHLPAIYRGLEYHGEGGFDSEGKNSFRLKWRLGCLASQIIGIVQMISSAFLIMSNLHSCISDCVCTGSNWQSKQAPAFLKREPSYSTVYLKKPYVSNVAVKEFPIISAELQSSSKFSTPAEPPIDVILVTDLSEYHEHQPGGWCYTAER